MRSSPQRIHFPQLLVSGTQKSSVHDMRLGGHKWQKGSHERFHSMAPVYTVDNGWRTLPPLVDVAQAVVDIPQNFSFWSSCDAEWQHPGESEIPVMGSIAVDEVRPYPTLRRDQRTVLPAPSPFLQCSLSAVFFKDSNSENLGDFELVPNRNIL